MIIYDWLNLIKISPMKNPLLLVSDDVRAIVTKLVCQEIFVLLLVATAKQPYWNTWSTKGRGLALRLIIFA